MKKVPISLIIDDGSPFCDITEFCDIIKAYGVKGKYSVIPMPSCKGDIINGVEGIPEEQLRGWIEKVKTDIMPVFDICPEILTHSNAYDIETGGFFEQDEKHWVDAQTRETLTPYIALAIKLLHKAELTPTGVTSPWDAGIGCEEEYGYAIAGAFDRVLGVKKSWYFLHTNSTNLGNEPKVVIRDGDRIVISVSSTVRDYFWQTMECEESSDEYVNSIADLYITADGKSGQIIEEIKIGSPIVMLTHVQSLDSCGRRTGMKAFRLVCERIDKYLKDKVEWIDFTALIKDLN
ncbi:MAG: hypothetical protein GX633_07120 [Clostridiales bacterium]|nr:hypothetical protein [Clostridiales bacterium]